MKRILLSLVVAGLATSPAAFPADLPTGESLFQQSVAKSGGAEAFGKIKTAVLSGTINMPAQNVSGSMKIYSDGDKNYTVVELPGIGKIEDGYDGDVAWEVSALQGPRIKDGEEKAALKNASSVNMMKNWKERFKELKTVAIEDVEGKPAYKVQANPIEGKQMTLFFDKDSLLVVKLSVVVPSPMGEVPTETLLTEYKPVSGVMTPFTMTQKILTTSIITHFDQVQYNVDVPRDRFDLPGPIQALVAKKKSQQ